MAVRGSTVHFNNLHIVNDFPIFQFYHDDHARKYRLALNTAQLGLVESLKPIS